MLQRPGVYILSGFHIDLNACSIDLDQFITIFNLMQYKI